MRELHARSGASRLFSGKTTPQSIRIARAGGIPATAHIDRYSRRLMDLSRYARLACVVLAGVGLTAACRQIANEIDQNKKNDILVCPPTIVFGAAA